MTNSKKFTKSELNKINFRWMWHSQIGWNYGRMQGLGYLTTMLPVIEKLYGDNPEAKEHALRAHSQFFNTTPQMGDIILGINIAIEEEKGIEGVDTAVAIKTALMGPFAGIGDTIFGVIGGTIFGSIACTMAVEGNYVGIAMWTLWLLSIIFVIRPWFFKMGYAQGINLVTTMSDKLNALTEAAGVLGVTVVGAMVALMVNVKLGSIEVIEGLPFDLQTGLADKIMPGLMSALTVFVFYNLLGRKGMNSNKLIFIAVVISLVLGYFGVLV